MEAEQPAFEGLAPRRRHRRATKTTSRVAASRLPIAQVVIDVQATHLGRSFDYLIDEKHSDAAVPGAMVRVRFGGRLIDGVIWNRVAHSDTPTSSLRFLERVYPGPPLVSASLRDDIAAIATAYGGTRANILRLAVPPRVARVEQEQRLAGARGATTRDDDGPFGPRRPHLERARDAVFARMCGEYDAVPRLHAAIEGTGFASFVVDALAGAGRWAADAAWMALDAMLSDKPVVMVLPGMREVDDVAWALRRLGLCPFSPSGAMHGGFDGDFAVLSASMPPAERYRAFLAAASGQVRCVIGPRAAMYAPVEGPALFMIVDDLAYQNMDGMMPYANARGVLRLRAQRHGGVFVALSYARSPISQWECAGAANGVRDIVNTPVSGFSAPVHALQAVTRDEAPWIRWLNRDELARLADPSIGSRMPHTAVGVIRRALEEGPVLLSIPSDGVFASLSCARCHRQVRCARCTGPLQMLQMGEPLGPVGGAAAPRCAWCGAAAVNWTCPGCGGERMTVVRVGAAGTARELAGLFRGVPVVLSSSSQPHGIVATVPNRPQIVIATPGAEPRVIPDGGFTAAPALVDGVQPGGDATMHAESSGGQQVPGLFGEYRAVAILDAWTSLYAPGIDARPDALSAWMRAMSLCAPRSRGGVGLLIGEADPVAAQSLMLWNSPMLAAHEIRERAETGMPPVVAAACVWGARPAVMKALERIGVTLTGEWGVIDVDGEQMPAMLGPVPIPPPATLDARELEATRDRVKAVVRVSVGRRAELAQRLHEAVALHVASRGHGELRFRLDPKDLI